MAEAKAEVDKQLVLPAGYALTWSGQYEYMERAKARLAYVVPLTVAIIVLLLYLAFRRFQEVLLILTTLPLAVVGGSGPSGCWTSTSRWRSGWALSPWPGWRWRPAS